jgi:hypothetical protein
MRKDKGEEEDGSKEPEMANEKRGRTARAADFVGGLYDDDVRETADKNGGGFARVRKSNVDERKSKHETRSNELKHANHRKRERERERKRARKAFCVDK